MENVNVQQNQEQNTFFTTLNRPDNSIKEFLSENNDGLNFLQDSQLHANEHDTQFQSQDSSNFKIKSKKMLSVLLKFFFFKPRIRRC
jgi:hypothetical protein